MDTVISTDNTPIAYWSEGDGPPLVTVHGGTADHTRWRPVVPLLGPHATVCAIDRRGRGGSGDAPDYVIDWEFEDVAAVVGALAERTGGPVDLLGHSFGAICALGGARLPGPALRRLVLYEPPISPGEGGLAPGIIERLEALLVQGRRDEVIEVFFREQVMLPAHELAVLRDRPAWQARVAAAHTIPRELRAVRDFRPAPQWFAAVTVPTLLLLGGDSPPDVVASTDLVRDALADARVEVMPGQQHVAIDTAPEMFAERVSSFLAGG